MSEKLGYLGPPGTNSEEAASIYNTTKMEMVPSPSIIDVFNAIYAGEVDKGILPLENSMEGSVNITLDLLAGKHNLKICGEVVLDVAHVLASRPGIKVKDITAIVSHPQALAQCRAYLEKNLPGVAKMKVNSTAEAARIVAHNSETWAVIANAKAIKLHGLNIVADQIQDSKENKTRFLVLSKGETPIQPNCKTSIIVSITDRPGGLYQILKEFALKNINLTKIQSRPAKTNLGDYIFYIEFVGHYLEPKINDCLKAITDQVATIKLLGSYPEASVEKIKAVNEQIDWSLNQIREDIDIIDYQIVDLLAQRTRLVNIVGELKKGRKNIKDRNREKEVLNRLKEIASDKGFDPEVTEKMYRLLFEHFISIQRKNK